MTNFSGYTTDEIDSLTIELIQFLGESEASVPLVMLALCRAIVVLGNQQDLDTACKWIDDLADVPFDYATTPSFDDDDDS